jgi:hypothetical protein
VNTKVSSKMAKEKPGCFGPRWAVTQNENGYPGLELDRMMEYPSAARQGTCGTSSFGADEWREGGPPCEGPEEWPGWEQEDDQAYLPGILR